MKILTKYFIKELLKPFILAIFLFTFILLLESVFTITNFILTKGLKVFSAIKVLIFVCLTLLSLTVPMALLFAILLLYGRLSEENELTVLRASGMNLWQYTSQVFSICILLTLVMYGFNFYLAPRIHTQLNKSYVNILGQEKINFTDKAFVDIGNYHIYIDKVQKDKPHKLTGISIYKFEEDIVYRIFAKEGSVRITPGKGVTFTLAKGTIQYSSFNDPDRLTYFLFNKYRTTIPFSTQGTTYVKHLREMTHTDLIYTIDEYRKQNLPVRHLIIEYYSRLCISFAPVALALIALPLGIRLRRGTKSTGFGVSLLVLFVYYLAMIGTITLSESGILPTAMIFLLPNLLVAVPGIVLLQRLSKI